ncbi:MAG: PHP domain-containing protein [Phycisphaerales bacterium]
MSTNQELADRLARIARLQELLGFDKFRAISNERAARAIEGHPADMRALAADRSALLAIDGIGPKIADKIIEFVGTGAIKELDELTAKVPPGLLPLLDVPGLGPKTVRLFWQDAGVTDLPSLKKIIDDGSILNLPRMGEKAVQKLKDSLALMVEGEKRLPLGRALPVAEAFVEQLRKHKAVKQIMYAGSLRRGKDTIGDIDILVATPDPAAVSKAFLSLPQVRHVLASGETRCSVRSALVVKGRDAVDPKVAAETAATPPPTTEPTVQVDLKVVPLDSWGAAMMYFTGSKEHNVRLRERALKMGLTLSEYGLFPNDDHPEPPHKRGINPVAGKTEEDVYATLGVHWIPPELREDRGEIELFDLSHHSGPGVPPGSVSPAPSSGPVQRNPASKRSTRSTKPSARTSTATGRDARSTEDLATAAAPLPRLIELADIKAELHSHTTASDGVMSILEIARHAKSRGFHTLAITDHSKSSAIAGGLPPDRLRQHIKAVHAARKQIDGITLLAGSEVDILADGSLDYDDDLLAMLDIVVASPHTALSQDPATATKRLLKAVTHPLVRILGHPTGRLINKRPGLSPSMAEIYAAANQNRVALEINAHWMRLDLRDSHVKGAIDAGCLIAIDCDVHEPADFDNLRFGVTTARRGWVTPESCINTWDAKRLHAWLKR